MFGFNKCGIAVAGILAASCLASPASAATFLFTFDGATIDASGTLTTQDVPTTTGGLLITGVTGTANGATITGLLAPGTFASNDNLLFVGQTSLLSFGGFSFVAGGVESNIFRGTQTFGFFQSVAVSSPGTFTITAVTNPPPVGAIPEPGTWALMLMGFGFVGAAMRRRARTRVTVSYA